MIVLPCIEFFFYGGYVTYIFLFMWIGSLIYRLLR